MPGYRTYHRDRIGRGGGGVAIFVNNNCASKSLPVSNDSMDLELWVLVQSEEESTIIGALYQPPKSTCGYPPLVLYNFIEDSLEELLMQNPDASIILGGDFNELNVAEVSARTSLLLLVNTPMREKNILDVLMTSLPQLHQVKVVTLAVRLDHKAILASPNGGIWDRTKSSCTKQFRRRTPGQHAIHFCTSGTLASIGWRSVNQRPPGWNFMLSLWGGSIISIAANHSDFGGILPLFTQYSAIPIGMTKFRQN